LPVSPHAEKNHVFSGLEFCLLMAGQGNNRRAGGGGRDLGFDREAGGYVQVGGGGDSNQKVGFNPFITFLAERLTAFNPFYLNIFKVICGKFCHNLSCLSLKA
jgi:hypothetical protein